MADLLEAEGLTKRYGKSTVVDTVSFTIPAGVVAGLLGPNGAGKSTCLHMLTGVVPPDAGRVSIGGIPVSEPSAKLGFGFAPDDLPLPEALTGREYLVFHDRLRGRTDLERALEIVDAFDIVSAVDRQIAEYSHGMKRKIQLAAALMHTPDLLILDEPFRGLDPDATAVLSHLVGSMSRSGCSVLMATHDLARAETMCDEVVILDRGRVAATGQPQDLVHRFGRGESLETAFLVMTGRERDASRKKKLISASFERFSQ